jgi:hypothetical protein
MSQYNIIIGNEIRASYNSNSYNSIIISYNYNSNINNISINYTNLDYIYNIINNQIILNDDITRSREPSLAFKSDTKYIGEQCSICWENIENIETMAITNCNSIPHVFHTECIQTWAKRSSTCPNCRCEL